MARAAAVTSRIFYEFRPVAEHESEHHGTAGRTGWVRAANPRAFEHVAVAATGELRRAGRGGRQQVRGVAGADAGHGARKEELQQTERVGKPQLCRPHHAGDHLFGGQEAYTVADLRMDGTERAVLQRQGRQQQLGGMEGLCLHSLSFPRRPWVECGP